MKLPEDQLRQLHVPVGLGRKVTRRGLNGTLNCYVS